jgi:hypothetical protein
VELTQNDFIKGSFWFLFQRRVLLLSLCLPLPAIYALARQQGSATFGSLLVLLLVFAVFWGTIYLSVRRQFANIPLEKRNYQFLFFPDQVLLKTSVGESRLLWSAFFRLAESKNYLFLFVHKQLFHVIPKRCLASPEDLSWLQKIAKEKIGGTKSLPKNSRS